MEKKLNSSKVFDELTEKIKMFVDNGDSSTLGIICNILMIQLLTSEGFDDNVNKLNEINNDIDKSMEIVIKRFVKNKVSEIIEGVKNDKEIRKSNKN